MRNPAVTPVMACVAALAAAGCASAPSEQRFDAFQARLGALRAQVDERQAAAQRLDGAAREEQLARWQALLQFLLAAQAGAAQAYLSEDAAAFARIEAQVDEVVAACPDLAPTLARP